MEMFSTGLNFGYFPFEDTHLNAFCYYKPLLVRFNTQKGRASIELDQILQVKRNKCVLEEDFKVSLKQGNINLGLRTSINNYQVLFRHQTKTNTQDSQSKEDLQLTTGKQSQTELYGSMGADRKLQNNSFKLGLTRSTASWLIDTNIAASCLPHKTQYYFYGRYLFFHPKCTLGFLSLVDLNHRNLQSNNLVLELKPHQKHKLYLRAEVDGLRNYILHYSKLRNYFDYISLNYLTTPTQTLTLMAQIKYDLDQGKIKHMESLIQKEFADRQRKLKMKINSQTDITLQYSFPLNLGAHSTVDFGLHLTDLLKRPRISYGLKVDLHY